MDVLNPVFMTPNITVLTKTKILKIYFAFSNET